MCRRATIKAESANHNNWTIFGVVNIFELIPPPMKITQDFCVSDKGLVRNVAVHQQAKVDRVACEKWWVVSHLYERHPCCKQQQGPLSGRYMCDVRWSCFCLECEGHNLCSVSVRFCGNVGELVKYRTKEMASSSEGIQCRSVFSVLLVSQESNMVGILNGTTACTTAVTRVGVRDLGGRGRG
jgi:hypothetical protein